MARIAPLAALVGAALLLAGCASQPMPDHPAPEDPIAAARELPDAPEVVQDAATCGEVELDQGGTLSDEQVACVDDAIEEGGDAGLVWVSPTVEGDPLPTFAIVRAGQLEVWRTQAFDAHGSGIGWYEVEGCERPLPERGC